MAKYYKLHSYFYFDWGATVVQFSKVGSENNVWIISTSPAQSQYFYFGPKK